MKKRAKIKFNSARFVKFIFAMICICYVAWTLLGQEMAQATNARRLAAIGEKVAQQEALHDELTAQKALVGTPEYIEWVARERGGLVKADEIIFIDPHEN